MVEWNRESGIRQQASGCLELTIACYLQRIRGRCHDKVPYRGGEGFELLGIQMIRTDSVEG